MSKYTLRHLAELMDVSSFVNKNVGGVCVDTRLLQPNDLFFALPGARVDGHAFVSEAAAKGASAAVVSRNFTAHLPEFPLIRVDDPMASFQYLAARLIKMHSQRVIAVTGSLGKTTTKEFITHLLKPKYRVSSSKGNQNSQIGLPLSIINDTSQQDEIIVLEMGMTHVGNIKKLVEIAPPEVALITTTNLVHACNFDTLADIGRAKAEIFSSPKTRVGIVGREIVNFDEICHIGNCKKVSISTENREADYYLEILSEKMQLHARECNLIFDKLPVPGKHNIHNFLCAAMAARFVGVSWEEIISALPALKLPERRLEFVERQGILFVNDSYNAATASMKAALQSLPEPKQGGKKIAVLGEMLELGEHSAKAHKEVGAFALDYVDKLLCFGDGCKVMAEEWSKQGRYAEYHESRAGVVNALRNQVSIGDVVLLKGSRAKEVWKVLEEL